MSIIKVRNLHKIFGPRPELVMDLLQQGKSKQEVLEQTQCTIAARGLNFDVSAGEIFVIMGLSGSGKSTVLRLLNRLIEPTSGTVEIHGQDVCKLSGPELRNLRNQKLSMVFQHFAIFPHRTVRENVEYGLKVRGVAESDRKERVDWALQNVGLDGWGDSSPSSLSGGMKQRVGLARALATDADIMLMDEPFSALDPLIRRDMQDLLLRLHHDLKRTIIFVTHDLNEAMRIGMRIMLMKDGELVQLGTGADILSNPANEYVSNFVSDVDRVRVLTALDLMAEPPMVVRVGDDLSDVVRRLQQCGAEGTYVLDERRLAGSITLKALEPGTTAVGATLEMAHIDTNFRTTRADTLLIDLCELVLSQGLPLAVLDDDRRLLGTVSSKAILKAIATKNIGVRSHG